MAGTINKVTLLGHLGKDPEIRSMSSGDKIANLTVATAESWKDKATGERRERTEWHKVVIYNQATVKVAESYLRKGSKVYLEGQLATRKWTDGQGIERYSTEILIKPFAGELVLLDRPPSGREDDARPARAADARGRSADEAPPQSFDLDDEIPF